MDINQFRKHLAKNQKNLNEARQSKIPLIFANKFLDKTAESLDEAISQLEEYLDVATEANELSTQDIRDIKSSLAELEKLQNMLDRVSNKIPTTS